MSLSPGIKLGVFFTPAQLKTIRSIRKWRPPLARRFQRVSSTWSSHWGAPLSWFLHFFPRPGVHHGLDSSPLVFRQGEPIRPFFGPAPSMLWEPVRSPKCANQRPKHIQPPILVKKRCASCPTNFVGRRIFPTAIFLGKRSQNWLKGGHQVIFGFNWTQMLQILLLMNANVVKFPKLSWFLDVQMIENNHDLLC